MTRPNTPKSLAIVAAGLLSMVAMAGCAVVLPIEAEKDTPEAAVDISAYAAPSLTTTGQSVAVSLAAQNVIMPATLTTSESSGLAYMREEEKLAHDLYAAFAEKWGLRLFANIAASEATHTATVLGILERYDQPDSAAGNAAGEFSDPSLQTLYDSLLAQGSVSLAAALHVGAAVEEIDIIDLEERLAQTTNADIVRVYTSLKNASGNHLSAFVSTLARQAGESYTPQYLDAAAYTALISGLPGNGPQGPATLDAATPGMGARGGARGPRR